MVKTIRNTFAALLALLVLAVAALPLPALAAASNTAADIGFYVRAIIPENQIDTTLSYFDLHMQPGDTQRLEVEVVNESAEAITVGLDAVSASTNRNGVIDYKTPDIRDETLKIPFSSIAALDEPAITLAPGETKTVGVTLRMPETLFDGVVLGGLVLTKAPKAAAEGSGDTIAIQNVYSYVIGVKLSETEAAVTPSFQLLSVEAELMNNQAVYMHYIRNSEAAIVKNMALNVDIYRDGESEPVLTVSKTGVDMAPNSVMPLAATLGEGQALEAGDYTSVVNVTHGGEHWSFENKFTVGAGQATDINNSIVPTQAAAFFLPTWLLVAGGVVLAALLLIIILLLVLLRRRKRDDEDEEGQGPVKSYRYQRPASKKLAHRHR